MASASSNDQQPPPTPSPDKLRHKSARALPQSPDAPDARPPQKRARKAINCEPCRSSKLKCDRNRPCSSCVLRGTTASCYQDGGGASVPVERPTRVTDTNYIDPVQEIARIRHSLSLLEASVKPNSKLKITPRTNDATILKREDIAHDVGEGSSSNVPPGMLAPVGQGGLYTGLTSATSHLILVDKNAPPEDTSIGNADESSANEFSEYDSDLIDKIPPLDVTEALISHYFDYCSWIYRHVNEPSFRQRWERFKVGGFGDRLCLATLFVIIAVAVHYLPGQHHLLDAFNSASSNDVGQQFYLHAKTALRRHVKESKAYSLELVELLLIRTHYLTFVKTETEEIWQVVGELVTIAKAMGLHRDPSKWNMPMEIAERRRWAWWYIILLERWQAFMFGRPLAIASHHFDTELPTYCDPSIDPTGRIFLPVIHLFRVAYILGDIVDQALSVRTISYDTIRSNDRALTDWYSSIPSELDLNEYQIARALASEDTATRRFGVQSVIIRSSYYHIRFTLHRPYASSAHSTASASGRHHQPTITDPVKCAQSLEIAVSSAEKLINMVSNSHPDFLANSTLAVPGHLNWGPFHCFSAAMFFSFQLLANPDQPGASLFRACINKALVLLHQCRGSAIADKGYEILNALSPLCSPNIEKDDAETRESAKKHVISTVRKLAFPYHDSHTYHRRGGDGSSPRSGRSLESPSASNTLSPLTMSDRSDTQLPTSSAQAQHQQQQQQYEMSFGTTTGHHIVSSIRTTNEPPPPPPLQKMHQAGAMYPRNGPNSPAGGGGAGGGSGGGLLRSTAPTLLPAPAGDGSSSSDRGMSTNGPPSGHTQQQQASTNYTGPSPYYDQPTTYPPSAAGQALDMWGASTGLEQGEWAQLMSVLQPQRRNNTASGYHHQHHPQHHSQPA